MGQDSRLQGCMISAPQHLQPRLEHSKPGAGIIGSSLTHTSVLDAGCPPGVPLGLSAETPTCSLSRWPGFLKHVVRFQEQPAIIETEKDRDRRRFHGVSARSAQLQGWWGVNDPLYVGRSTLPQSPGKFPLCTIGPQCTGGPWELAGRAEITERSPRAGAVRGT